MKELPDDWSERRDRVLDRDDRECRNCGDSEQLEVHYIVPPVVGGTDTISNLATLCNDCFVACQRTRRRYPLDFDDQTDRKIDKTARERPESLRND